MDIFNNKYVVLDLETSGLNKNYDYIIEVGAVKIENGEISERFSTLVNTTQMRELPKEIEVLTGIKFADLQSAPSIDSVLRELYGFMKGCTLVVHNLPFDYAFLRNWGFWCGVHFDEFSDGIDTVKLAQEKLGDKVLNFKLPTLTNYFNIEFTNHRALHDAETTAKIFLELIQL